MLNTCEKSTFLPVPSRCLKSCILNAQDLQNSRANLGVKKPRSKGFVIYEFPPLGGGASPVSYEILPEIKQ